ncbi:MAG: hypothetical protein NTY19_25410 [Planctomycetota bacterium]|nr:hypothetical protein [Planctomycetota bacterium]
MTAFGAREAIIRPLDHAGVSYSQVLVTRLINLLRDENFDPSMLQIICTEVYRQAVRRDASHVGLTEEDLSAVGGLEGILKNYLDIVMRSLRDEAGPADENLLLAQMILDTLITREDTKQAVTLNDLTEAGFLAREDEILSILRVFETRRLVRCEIRDGQPWYELVHERLVRPVQHWLKQDKDFFNYQIARDLVENSCRGGLWRSRPGLLLNCGQVEGVVGPYRERLRFDADNLEFLFRSAMFSRSREANYWAQRYGLEASTAILLEAIQHPDAEMRLGAATVAGQFPDPDSKILVAVQQLGAESREELRLAAGRSLAQLRRQVRQRSVSPTVATQASTLGRSYDWLVRAMPTLARLGVRIFSPLVHLVGQIVSPFLRPVSAAVRRLVRAWKIGRERGIVAAWRESRDNSTQPQMDLHVLAAMVLEGDDLREYSPFRRFRARLLAGALFRRSNADAIRAHSKSAIRDGAAAGVAWALSIGAVSLGFFAFLNRFDPTMPWFGSFPLLMLLLSLFQGVLFAWATAEIGAEAVLRSDNRYRPFRLIRSKLVAGCSLLFTLWLLYELFDRGLEFELRSWVGHSSLSLVLSVLVGLSVVSLFGAFAVLEGAVTLVLRSTPASGRLGPWPWALLLALAFPFCVYSAVILLISIDFSDVGLLFPVALAAKITSILFERTRWLVPVALAAELSFLIMVVSVTRWNVRRSAATSPEASTTVRPASRRTRLACLIVGLAMLPMFEMIIGFDVFWCRTVDLPESGAVSLEMKSRPWKRAVQEIALRTKDDAIVMVDTPDEQKVASGAVGLLAGLTYIPRGTHYLTLQNRRRENTYRNPNLEARIILTPVPFDQRGMWIGRDDEPLFRALLMKSTSAKTNEWTATLSGKIAVEAKQLEERVELILNASYGMADMGSSLIVGSAEIDGAEVDSEGVPRTDGHANRTPFILSRPTVIGRFSPTGIRRIKLLPVVGRTGEWKVTIRVEPQDSISAEKLEDGAILYASMKMPAKSNASALSASAPQDSVAKLLDEAASYKSRSQWGDAIAAYQRALGLANDSSAKAKVHNLLSIAFERNEDLASALRESEAAVVIEPDNPVFQNSLAWHLCLAGRFEEALPHARKSVSLNSEKYNLDTLAHAAYGTGHWFEAVFAWKTGGFLSGEHCREDRNHYAEALKRVNAEEAEQRAAPSTKMPSDDADTTP